MSMRKIICQRRKFLQLDGKLINWAASVAEYYLAPLGNRWLHVQGVAEKARKVSRAFPEEEGIVLVAAAYVHDIGYAPQLKKTDFHPLDGAYYLRSSGYSRLASLVAHHSEAIFEARLRGLGAALNEFPREYSPIADALTYCDQTVGPTGKAVTLEERVNEVLSRYRQTDVVVQALHQSISSLFHTVENTQRMLWVCGLM